MCDEMGLMVWQDSLFAWGAYPEGATSTKIIAEEAANTSRSFQKSRLFCGTATTEKHLGYLDWGGNRKSATETGSKVSSDVLPKICCQSIRPALLGRQPVSGRSNITPNADEHGQKSVGTRGTPPTISSTEILDGFLHGGSGHWGPQLSKRSPLDSRRSAAYRFALDERST